LNSSWSEWRRAFFATKFLKYRLSKWVGVWWSRGSCTLSFPLLGHLLCSDLANEALMLESL
jgi:hypothetical protein